MHVVVYLDVLFAINLLMNGMVLACMKVCLREKTTWLRWLAASLAGAVLYCIAIFLPFQGKNLLYGGYFILTAAVMVRIAFAVKGRIRTWIAYVVVQYLTAGALGGIMNGIYYALRTESPAKTALTAERREGYGEQGTVGFLLTAGAAAFVFYVGNRLLYRRKQKEECRYRVFIRLGEQTGTVKALLDTGNSLTEPVSHAPVIVGDAAGLSELLNEKEQKQIKEFYETGYYESGKKIRLIPYHAVGVRTGILLSYLLDEVVIWKGEGQVIRKKGIYLAVSPIRVSSDGSYQLLLHPDMLNE